MSGEGTLNADGMIMDLPQNPRAAQLMYESGLGLAGSARGTARHGTP